MQRNFILTDVMKTGNTTDLTQFIAMNTMNDQVFDTASEYYTLHNYDLDSYDRKFAVIDVRTDNIRFSHNDYFNSELKKRCDLLKSQGFVFICATPWESIHNIENTTSFNPDIGRQDSIYFPKFEIEHIKWSAGTSWFWFYMYKKHKDNTFKFSHDHNGSYWHKKHDFLYLNKAPRKHRVNLYNKLKDADVLDNSIYSFTMLDEPIRLEKKYELPGVDPKDYPRFGKDQDMYELPYIDTVCSIVSETNDNDYEVFMTEKIWKAIIAQHVFVVHGNHLYLQRLRGMGFKTFGNYFDEGYDLEQDPDKKIDKIVALIKDLKSKCDDGSIAERGNKKWQDIYLQTKALRQHNYDTMFNKEKLSLEINKTLDLFLEFADSR